MKKIYMLVSAVLLSAAAIAQSPEKMSYQAVIRNATNTLLTNQPVGMQITIIKGSVSGTPVYVETQSPTSNINGLVSLEIGTGSIVSGDFSAIDWSAGPYYIKTESDPTGGTSYTVTGVSQLMSVPYALYAKTSGSSTPGPQGPAGLDGADGINGLNGADGVDGLDGATGPMGPQGPTGATGPAGTYTAGSGIDITGGVISSTGSSTMPEYAYASIDSASTLGAQSLTAMSPPATYVNGVVMNGSSITLHANKMYEVTVAFYIYNATGGHVYRLKDATNSQYLATELYFGQGGSDISYNISTTSCLIKPSTDITLELEKTQGTDVNLIGKIVVKEIK